MTQLPNFDRCQGVNTEGEWREGCETCQRRTSPALDGAQWIEPPAIVVFECEYLIKETK